MRVTTETSTTTAQGQPSDWTIRLVAHRSSSAARALIVALAGTLGAFAFCAADAADTAPDAAVEATATSPTSELESITVIARKVEESAQTVPLSIVALSAADLKADNVFTVEDLQYHVTGLVISPNSQGGAPTFAIRAAKQDNGTDGGVAVYLEDVPMASTIAIANSLFDLQSVDVLKGPQGTLFGVNTTGGAVMFRPNKPTGTFDFYAEGEGGNYNRAYFEGMVNVPVNDWLQIRASGNLLDRHGFITNFTPAPGIPADLETDHYRSARLIIRTMFGPVTNDVIGTYYTETDTGPVEVPIELLPAVQALGAKTYGAWTVSLGGNASGVNLPIYNNAKITGFEDALNWEITDKVSLHNALSLYDNYLNTFQDNDGTFIDMVNGRTETKIRQWIEEPTLHVTWLDGKLRYTGGLWYSHTTRDDGNSYDLAQNFLYQVPAGAFFPGIPPNIPPVPATNAPVAQLSNSYYKRDKFSRAVYSQSDYDVNEQLTVTLGLRYNWDEISLLNSQHGYLASLGQFSAPDPTGNFYGGVCQAGLLRYYANFNPTACTGTAKKNFSAPSFNFGIRNKIGDASILYFKIAGGYQAGGLNNQIREQAYQSFLPEKTTEFESGVKSDWTLLGRPIRTNLDGFYGHARDKQEVENGAYADGGQWIAVFNAGSLTYYGGDLQVEMVVTDWLTLSGDWTRMWTSYDNFVFPAIGIIPQTTLTGARPAQIPGNTINGNATVYWPMPQSAGKLSSTLTAYHRSAIAFSDIVNLSGSLGTLNSSDGEGQAFTTMNFSSSWSNIFGSHISAGVWVKNLQDKLYRTFAGPQANLGYAVVTYGDPRTYGANLRYNFR